MKIDINRLHKVFFDRSGRGVGNTFLSVISLIGYLEVLQQTENEYKKIVVVAHNDVECANFKKKYIHEILDQYFPQYKMKIIEPNVVQIYPFRNKISFHSSHTFKNNGYELEPIIDTSNFT